MMTAIVRDSLHKNDLTFEY